MISYECYNSKKKLNSGDTTIMSLLLILGCLLIMVYSSKIYITYTALFLIFIFIFTISMIALASCTIIDDTHIHCFEEGICDCGELEANQPETQKYNVVLLFI